MKRFSFLMVLAALILGFSACEKKELNLPEEKPIANDSIVANEQHLDTNITYESVDLGLPSGTLWASTNIGAATPENYGVYFAWGETALKNEFSWANYKYCNYDQKYGEFNEYIPENIEITKYNDTDNVFALEQADDAAFVYMGSNWRMPTFDDFIELKDNCVCSWVKRNGVNGYEFKGKNENSIFLPAAGVYTYQGNKKEDIRGEYWSLSTKYSYKDFAYCLYFTSDKCEWSYGFRYCGRPIRAVCSK